MNTFMCEHIFRIIEIDGLMIISPIDRHIQNSNYEDTICTLQIQVHKISTLELFSLIYLTKLPVCWSNIVWCECFPVTGGHLKRQRLPCKIDVGLPVLAPVSCHRYPSCFWSLHFHSNDFTIQTHIGYKNLIEVRASTHCESQPTPAFTLHPAQISESQHVPN